MKILVVSDTHGREGNLALMLRRLKPIDHLIHCGDLDDHMDKIREMAECPCTFVGGNNDYYSSLPGEAVVEFGDYRIFVTHGHLYGVHFGLGGVQKAAVARACNCAFFGHTHVPYLDAAMSPYGLTTLNPGSATLPRQPGRRPSCAVMEIDRFGKAHFSIRYLNASGSLEVGQ